MPNDSIELGRIRAKVLDLEDKTEKLTIVNSTASFDQTVSITGNLYVNGELLDVSIYDLTSALAPYLTIVSASSLYSTPAQITASYPTRLETTNALGNYVLTSTANATYVTPSQITASFGLKTDISSSFVAKADLTSSTAFDNRYSTPAQITASYPTRVEVTGAINNITSSLSSSYARLAAVNTFSANQIITGTLNASSNISGNANLIIGGNIGVGINPSDKLHTYNTNNANNGIIVDTSNAGYQTYLSLAATGSTAWQFGRQGSGSNNQLFLYDASGARDVIRANPGASGDLLLQPVNGDVGIGVTSALEKLHVVGNAIIGTTFNSANGYPNSDLIIHVTDATSALGQENAISIFRQQSADSWPQIATMTIGRYETGTTEARTRLDFNLKHANVGTDTAEVNVMSLNSAGNVGIGTTTPQKPLDVATAGGIRISRTENSSSNNEIFFQDNGQISSFDQYHRIIFDRPNDKLELREYGDIIFSAGATSATRTETVTIKNNGRVGIGTTAPGVNLSVKGQVSVSPVGTGEDVVYNGSFISTKPITSGQHINLIRVGNHARSLGFVPNTNTFAIAGGVSNDANFGNSIPFVIDDAGKVGIGTTNPSSKLTVVDNGYPSVLISSSYVASSKVYSSIQFGASSVNGGGDIGFVHDRTTPANSFFHITPYGSTQGTAYSLGSDGNSGFGVANPFNKIHIDTTVANDGIYLNGNSSLWTSLRTNLGAGAYNSITNANDRGIIYGGASDGSPGGGFVIAPWATGPSGLRINENGNVGIGITSPAVTLEVSGTIKSGRISTTEGGELQLARGFDNAVKWTIDAFGSGDSSAFRIFDNTGSIAFYINPTNRYVGLGGSVSSIPTVPLHVKNGNSTYTDPENNNLPTIFASNTSNASTNAHAILGTRVGGASGGDPFISFDISGVTGWSIGVDNSDSDKFKISNAWNDVGTSTDLTIQTNGNVGIGTTSPSASLHVKQNGGSVNIEGTDHTYMQWYPDGFAAGRKAYTGYPSAAVDDFYIANEILNADIILDPNGGNVGIDTASPTYKLDVNGSIRATADSVINNNQIFSDNITINGGGSGNRYAYVDFVGDATYTDYGLRVIRNNGGANTSSEIVHRGTGNFYISAGVTAGETSNIVFFVNGAYRQVSDSAGDFRPYYTNDSKLGNSTYRWEELWLSNTSINPSDEREKFDIFNSDLGLEFIKKLRPVSYKWKSAKTIVSSSITFDDVGNKIVHDTTSSLPGKRNHYGLIAQEVEQVLNGKDFAGFIRDREADVYALRYGEFISPIIKAVQELSEENNYLKNKLEEKENQINDILARLSALENK